MTATVFENYQRNPLFVWLGLYQFRSRDSYVCVWDGVDCRLSTGFQYIYPVSENKQKKSQYHKTIRYVPTVKHGRDVTDFIDSYIQGEKWAQ